MRLPLILTLCFALSIHIPLVSPSRHVQRFSFNRSLLGETIDYHNNESLTPPAELDNSLDTTTIFIMGSTGHMQQAPWFNWYTRIVPSFHTWASAFNNVFVVMPNSEYMDIFLSEHKCFNETNNIEFHCPEWGARDGPTLLLTQIWNCNDNYHGDGPCCKANFAYWYMLTMRRSLLLKTKWMAFIDDDIYIHGKSMQLILNKFDSKRPLAIVPSEKCFRAPFRSSKPNDLFPRGCRLADSYWAHPIWLSTAALLKVEVGILAGGIRDQCEVLGTSHETALGQFLWMYQVPCAGLGRVYSPQAALSDKSVVVHRARPKQPFSWEHGTALTDIPTGFIKMHQVHESVTATRLAKGVDTGEHPTPIKQPKGYLKSKHSLAFNISQKWTRLTDKDC